MTNLLDANTAESHLPDRCSLPVPHYLQTTYWWAYIHPRGVQVFERQWLVNLILWGNYTRLCDALLLSYGQQLPGKTLQIACAYGNLTQRLAGCLTLDSTLDVIDILPIQLNNLAHKLPENTAVRLHCMDSRHLDFPDQHFDRALLFFLLHEQPPEVRKKTLVEAIRVIRPGGTLTIVDYAGPGVFNPLRYFMAPLLGVLEPYARDLWKEEVMTWFPQHENIALISKQRFFGGLYQILTIKAG